MVNEKQAKIVRRIYKEFLDGKGANRIARDLELSGVPNWNGKAKWYEGSIRKMLTNEKYKGDALLQKTYTVDFLSKKRADNNGEVPQYYVEDSHPAIIDKEMWEAVQLEMERRRNFALQYGIQKLEYATTDNPFAEEYFRLSLLCVIRRNDRKLGTSRCTPADCAKNAPGA